MLLNMHSKCISKTGDVGDEKKPVRKYTLAKLL